MTDLARSVFGATFQNPVLLAAGTCGFAQELDEVVDLEALGGIVTKSVTLEPRQGNPPPRLAEFPGGMVNSVGLANPGVDAVRAEKLPWLHRNLRRPRVFVSVAGHAPEEFGEIVTRLDDGEGFLGFELNLSCPNDARRSALPFALDPAEAAAVVGRVRPLTRRPLLAKMAPNAPGLAAVARAVADAGADGLTVANTVPGYLPLPGKGAPALGAGGGGVSGPLLRPLAIRAVREVREAVDLPLVGVGGICTAGHAVEYLAAGASLVQIGTASFADPRAALRVIKDLERWSGLPLHEKADPKAPIHSSPAGLAPDG